jgi:hypothetical protein
MQEDLEGEFENKKKYFGLSDEKIKEIAKGMYRNEIFTSMQIPEYDQHLLQSIFMPLIFLDTLSIKQMELDEICGFYANMSDAAPGSINGYPCFFSLNILNREDITKILEEYKKIVDVLGE